MTEHLGGPETEAKVLARHRRYLALDDAGWMFRIVADGAPAGSIGFWHQGWNSGQVYETGWAVLPAFQGRGLAVAAALQVIALARKHGDHRHLHAFPSIHHGASNGICRRAGFTLQGECDVEYPKGSLKRCNDWRVDLSVEP
ncbi:GNAT family N-acetyltransferase [Pseudonocardia sp. GCM10023141]|uniref:GNAT family N-acetyltransferase n=1 Tax=Pseudonocardia sp. GCM10023141 TaxID=3252653 RepID=UPI00360AFE8E